MRKQLIFHVGYHKTGSSSIQAWLAENAPVLSEVMSCYNLVEGGSNPLKIAVHHYIMGQGNIGEIRAECRKIHAEILAQTQEVACFTDEGILGPPLGITHQEFTEEQIYPHARTISAILAEEFSDFSPVFVAYERDPDAWLKSIHNQMTKQGYFTGDISDFQARFPVQVDWATLRNELRAGIAGNGELVHVRFEDEFPAPKAHDITLFRLLGIPAALFERCNATLKHVNPSSDLAQVAVHPAGQQAPAATPVPQGRPTAEQIKFAYHLFLNRNPTENEVANMLAHVDSIALLRQTFLSSQEFQALLK